MYAEKAPLEWSPVGVDNFFSWWTDKVAAADLDDALLSVVEAWVRFALERKGLARRFVDSVIRDVHDVCGEFAIGGTHSSRCMATRTSPVLGLIDQGAEASAGMPGGDHRVFLADAALLVSEYRSQLVELRDAP